MRERIKISRRAQASIKHNNKILSYRQGQASMEAIIIFGVSSLILLTLVGAGLQSQSSTTDTLRLSQARTTVTTIARTAEEVWSQGPGASKRVIINVPEAINETESGIFNDKTLRYRVLIGTAFTDVSEISSIKIIGNLPEIGGEYEVILTAREDDVLLTVVKSIDVGTDKDVYVEGEALNYFITTLDEQGRARDTDLTVQLIDANGILRDEQNVTTINGLINGSFVLPVLSIYGEWKVYAFDNETYGYKNVIVMVYGGVTNLSEITIFSCQASDTLLSYTDTSTISCQILSDYPLDTVLFKTVSPPTNYTAWNDTGYWWRQTLTCQENRLWTWHEVWANDTTGYTFYTIGSGLPISIKCNVIKPKINSTKPDKTGVAINTPVCINTTATDDTRVDNVWAQIIIPEGDAISLELNDTGVWCAGSANDSWYGAEFELTELGTYTLVSGQARDDVGNIGIDLVNIEMYVVEVARLTEGEIFVSFPDAATKNREETHSFVVVNNNTVELSYIYEVQEIWDHGWSSSSACTLISPLGADFSCVCSSSGNQCNATWHGTFPISPLNMITFAYSFDNSGLEAPDIKTTATFRIMNGTRVSKSRTLDFISNVPTAQVYISANKINWSQGINYVNGSTQATIHVMLKEESAKSPTQITNPNVTLMLPKSWSNVTSPTAVITDKGDYWEINQSFTTIGTGQNKTFNFTGITPERTGFTIIHATINSSRASEYINNTNIHELVIRTIKQCNSHANCTSNDYCSLEGACLDKKMVGGNCSIGIVFPGLTRNETCLSGYCRQDFNKTNAWYCVNNSQACTEKGNNRNTGYTACINSTTSILCTNGTWNNQTTCANYVGCDNSSVKATYCGWEMIGEFCTPGNVCNATIPNGCNSCGDYYEDAPFNSCSYYYSQGGLPYCDEGCGALCDSLTDYYFNDEGDQCNYNCDNSCSWGSIDPCGDPGDLYGYTCYYGTAGCNNTGCSTQNEYCPTYCINDYDGGDCAVTTRTNPSSNDACYYGRQCINATGCNLSSSTLLRANYCDYCDAGGTLTGAYSALSPACTSSCPNSGTRYYDETVNRNDDCDGLGNSLLLTESYMTGYTYPNQTLAGTCSNTECTLDCGTGFKGRCDAGTCKCIPRIFYETFTPSPYYNYNWTRWGDWDSVTGTACYGGSGDCAHCEKTCTDAGDWINTTANKINLSGALNAYVQFQVKEDTDFDSGEYLRLYCWNSTGWMKFYEENTGNWASDGTWRQRESLINTSCLISDARFKITIMSNQIQEKLYIDNFEVYKEV